MKFTFTVSNTVDCEKFVTESGGSEVNWHIALKLLGYLLFFDRRPQIEQDVGQHYRPDLFVWDEFQQNVALWVDCGNIAIKKIDKVATKMGKSGEFFILRRTEQDATRLHESIQKIKHPDRVNIIAFDTGFVDKIAELLDRTNEVSFSVIDFRSHLGLELTINGHDLNSRIIPISGAYTCTF